MIFPMLQAPFQDCFKVPVITATDGFQHPHPTGGLCALLRCNAEQLHRDAKPGQHAMLDRAEMAY